VRYADAATFSMEALDYLRDFGADCALLLYTRRVAAPLLGSLPLYNIHPSLLPAFPGLNAVEKAMDAGAHILGATLHGVDSGFDSGPIVAQIATGIPHDRSLASATKISFLQKTYLILLMHELLNDYGMTVNLETATVSYSRWPRAGINASPALSDRALIDAFATLQSIERCRVASASI
jgi:phosphoribosylglycinamide formyltransferase-1